jgi:hypothetical protein
MFFKIIISFGPGQFWPSSNGWAVSCLALKKMKINSRTLSKKNYDFLAYFSTHFT